MEENYFESVTKKSIGMGFSFIMLAFAVVSALAWMEFVKYIIKTYVKVPGTRGVYLFLFALVVTILAGISFISIRRFVPFNESDISKFFG